MFFISIKLCVIFIISLKYALGSLELPKNVVKYSKDDTFEAGNKTMVYFGREKSWQDAFNECRKIGMQLVTINTEEEHTDLFNYLHDRVWGKDKPALDIVYWYIWSSGTDVGPENHFVWKSTGQNLTFTSWGVGEPNGGTGENCIEFRYTTGSSLKWNDSVCTIKKRYICETKTTET